MSPTVGSRVDGLQASTAWAHRVASNRPLDDVSPEDDVVDLVVGDGNRSTEFDGQQGHHLAAVDADLEQVAPLRVGDNQKVVGQQLCTSITDTTLLMAAQ